MEKQTVQDWPQKLMKRLVQQHGNMVDDLSTNCPSLSKCELTSPRQLMRFQENSRDLAGGQKYPLTHSLNDLRQQKQASIQDNCDGCCNEFPWAFRKMWFHYKWREGIAWSSVRDDEKLYTHQNCKEKLNSVGIWKQQEQTVFLDIAIKDDGVLVAEHKTDLRARIHSPKQILEDEEKRISSTSSPQLWTNISSHKTNFSHIFMCCLVMSALRK